MKYYTHLTFTNRLKIERMRLDGASVSSIADALHVHISTIYRELKRGEYEHLNSDYTVEKRYSPDIAEERYQANLRAKGADLKIGADYELAAHIETKIADEHYSPAAVVGEIREKKLPFKTDVCAGTIYSYIEKGVFLRLTKKNLLRKGTRKREYKQVTPARAPKGESIENRPKEVADRTTFGHWEMDTIIGKKKTKSVLLCLTERYTRQEIVIKMPDKTTASCVKAIDRLERKFGSAKFRKLFKTITVDNGCEFQNYEGIEQSCLCKQKRTKLYFCHPYSSCERGSNENQNGMIRRFFPKGTNFDKVKADAIQHVVDWINAYPRGIFGYKSSDDVFAACIAEC